MKEIIRAVYVIGGLLLCLLTLAGAATQGADNGKNAAATNREILLCVAEDAPQSIHAAVEKMLAAPEEYPLLKALLATGAATGVRKIESAELLKGLNHERNYHRAAFNHLLLVGLPQADPLLIKCADHTVKITTAEAFFHCLGYGEFTGDLGWIETDRNPFAYSQRIATAPFPTLTIKITGTSENGVLEALRHFKLGVINAALAGTQIKRVRESILDGELDATPPPLPLPAQLGKNLVLAGWTQPGEDEYRAFLDYDARRPQKIWRIKYLAPGALEGVELYHWNNSPHRKAFGNAVNLVEFTSDTEAQQAYDALKSAEHRGQKQATESTLADQPALRVAVINDMQDMQNATSITIIRRGKYLAFSTLAEKPLLTFLEPYQ